MNEQRGWFHHKGKEHNYCLLVKRPDMELKLVSIMWPDVPTLLFSFFSAVICRAFHHPQSQGVLKWETVSGSHGSIFGYQLQRGGTKENPKVMEFCKPFQVINSITQFAKVWKLSRTEDENTPSTPQTKNQHTSY